jgi:hypothetical protein
MMTGGTFARLLELGHHVADLAYLSGFGSSRWNLHQAIQVQITDLT